MSFKLFFRYLNVGILTVVFILLASMFLTSSKAHAANKIYKIDLQQDRSQSRLLETMQQLQWLSEQSVVASSSALMPVMISTLYFPAYYSAVDLNSQFVGYWFAMSDSEKIFVGMENISSSSIYILSEEKNGNWSLWLPESDSRYPAFLSFLNRTLHLPMEKIVRSVACSKLY